MTRASPMRPRTKAARKNTGVASARRGLDMGGNDDDSDDEDDDEETTEAELSAMNVAKLKELCKERDLSDKGNKTELVARLLADA